VLAALRRGLSDEDSRKAGAVAASYVQLVYGRQLQRPTDEQPADPLDVSAMTREQRDSLKRRILAQHPELVQEFRPVDSSSLLVEPAAPARFRLARSSSR
jgi:hypothetical protein